MNHGHVDDRQGAASFVDQLWTPDHAHHLREIAWTTLRDINPALVLGAEIASDGPWPIVPRLRRQRFAIAQSNGNIPSQGIAADPHQGGFNLTPEARFGLALVHGGQDAREGGERRHVIAEPRARSDGFAVRRVDRGGHATSVPETCQVEGRGVGVGAGEAVSGDVCVDRPAAATPPSGCRSRGGRV